ncbi:Gp19/Gp15/Gp42 family protein [Eggerthella lenta]|uniref:Gp19/Gp15/Gp42 family protein n=1 Tax=Eggerthella lenta TaxID=84112 RepID=UPI0022E33FBA|nr:Gp19/Gp15/Gp42 family protein [Eggerthella lenta]
MEPFATADDLAARWRKLTDEEAKRADVLLGDCSAFVSSSLAKAGVAVDGADEAQAANIKSVCCSIVRRAMSVSEDMAGVSQYSQTAGPFSGSASYANPNADLYMTASEQRRLGIKRLRMGSIRPKIGAADDAR